MRCVAFTLLLFGLIPVCLASDQTEQAGASFTILSGPEVADSSKIAIPNLQNYVPHRSLWATDESREDACYAMLVARNSAPSRGAAPHLVLPSRDLPCPHGHDPFLPPGDGPTY